MPSIPETMESIMGFTLYYNSILESVKNADDPPRPTDWQDQLPAVAARYAGPICRCFEVGRTRLSRACDLLAEMAIELSRRVHPRHGPDVTYDTLESLIIEFGWTFFFYGDDREAEYRRFKQDMIAAILRRQRTKVAGLLRDVLHKR